MLWRSKGLALDKELDPSPLTMYSVPEVNSGSLTALAILWEATTASTLKTPLFDATKHVSAWYLTSPHHPLFYAHLYSPLKVE